MNELNNFKGQQKSNIPAAHPQVLLHSNFHKILEDVKKINIKIIEKPQITKFDFSAIPFSNSGNITQLEAKSKYKLDPRAGSLLIGRQKNLMGYDESKLQFNSLEGLAAFTSHSLIIVGNKDYIPINYLSFNFYSRSEDIKKKSSSIKLTKDYSIESNIDYLFERESLLLNYGIEDGILFLDGPLIGGNLTSYSVKLVNELHSKNIIPIFFVKNSESNLVTESITSLAGKYNSDMHWSYNFLDIEERTSLFLYKDQYNQQNAKVFCYLKAFNLSPQRVEVHESTFNIYADKLIEYFNLIMYLLVLHGDIKNPQLRPIAIAEKYARNTLKLLDIYSLIKNVGLTATMNEIRFGG